MSVQQYQQLGLSESSYKLVSLNQQEFLFQPTGSTTPVALMYIAQKQLATDSAAKAWFSQSSAQTAHTVLFTAQSN